MQTTSKNFGRSIHSTRDKTQVYWMILFSIKQTQDGLNRWAGVLNIGSSSIQEKGIVIITMLCRGVRRSLTIMEFLKMAGRGPAISLNSARALVM